MSSFIFKMLNGISGRPKDDVGCHGTGRQEQPSKWYDEKYRDSVEYAKSYHESVYYQIWTSIIDRLSADKVKGVLDVGCGSGQFGKMVVDSLKCSYFGVDFSNVAIEMARKMCPEGEFFVADIKSWEGIHDTNYDTVVCLEVLEHICDDRIVISNFPLGKRVLLSVPDFDSESHVRYFKSKEDVVKRYSDLLDNMTVLDVLEVKNGHCIFLFEGIRSKQFYVN